MFEFLFGKKTPNHPQTEEDIQPKRDPQPIQDTELPRIKLKKTFKKQRENFMYVVTNKTTSEILGIYNSLELAKQNGQGITYYNCAIYKYKINDLPKYLNNPIYED